jgi:diguanylate cyclase (GGDEF)-like protein
MAASDPAPAAAARVGFSRDRIALAGTFVGYVLLAQIGFGLAGQAAMAPPFRPASGVALAALVLCGLGAWPAVFAASLTVTLGLTRDPVLSLITAGGHTLSAVAGAVLVSRFADGRDVFRSIRSTLRAVGFIVASASLPAAVLAVSGSVWGGMAAGGWQAFVSGWLGQVTGTLVVAPWVMLMLTSDTRWPTRKEWPAVVEGVALVVSLAVVALSVFAGVTPTDVKTYPLEFLSLPFLLWAAFRFGPREVTIAVVMLSSVAVWGTLHGVGPFVNAPPAESERLLQAYLAVMSIAGIAFATTVDERRRAEAQLHELATTDPLTGLVNYRCLLDALRQEMARSRRTGRPFALLLVDMDGLKAINDRFGHLAGSRAICRVADVLRQSTRETDVVARFGGDEFAVVLPESGDAGGEAVLARVSERLARETAAPVLSVSGGHAVFPRDGDSPTLLLRAADRGLYEAKQRDQAFGLPAARVRGAVESAASAFVPRIAAGGSR